MNDFWQQHDKLVAGLERNGTNRISNQTKPDRSSMPTITVIPLSELRAACWSDIVSYCIVFLLPCIRLFAPQTVPNSAVARTSNEPTSHSIPSYPIAYLTACHRICDVTTHSIAESSHPSIGICLSRNVVTIARMQCPTLRFFLAILQYNTALHRTALYCTALHCIILHRTALHRTTLHV